jgi:hypothetical protein
MPAAKRGDRRGLVGWTLAALGTAGMVVGVLGLSLGWGSSSTARPAGTTTTTAAAEQPAAFLRSFLTAIQNGDTAYLVSRLDPAVIAQYGAARCTQSIMRSPPLPEAYQLLSVHGPELFQYKSAGRTTPVRNVYVFTVHGPKSGTLHFHFALVDGRYHWFTDCSVTGGA